jgi:hypothetical protein
MEKTELDRVLDKVQKCLALSKSAEPHEASAALRQAQKLMDKYNIDHQTLELAEIGELDIKSKVSVSRMKNWEQAFMHLLAKTFGFRVMFTASNSYAIDVFGTWTLVGLKTQLKLAEYAYAVLMPRLIKQRREFLATLPDWYSRDEKAAEGDGFALGWVRAIRSTVVEFSGMKELSEKLDLYQKTTYGELDKAKQQQKEVGNLGLGQGYEAGSKESLYRGVDGFETRRISHQG